MNLFLPLVLVTLLSLLGSCSERSEYGKKSDYEKLGYGPSGIATISGSGIIKGAVLDNASDALSGVSVTLAKSGTTSSVVTTEDNGTFSKTSLSSGNYTLTYSKSGYLEMSQLAELATDNETLSVATVKQFPDTCASTGTISGTLKDAVSDNAVSDVSLSVRSGLNTTSGTIIKTATTDSSGDYSLSSMSAGWYTIQFSKSGYIADKFDVYSCGNVGNQDASISTSLASGAMRIILHWGASSGLGVVDSHLTGPDNGSGRFHIYWPAAKRQFYYYTDNYSCSGCTAIQKSDNVTLDKDDTSAPGTETITIPTDSWRSGTYRYSAHYYGPTTSGQSTGLASNTLFAESGTTVKVYYGDTKPRTYNVPNSAGTLWTVFTIDGSSNVVTTVNTMSAVAGSSAGSASVE
tara:strand:- start:29 stop:1243 length:1215 start_codon:yes stop_codon:yes gene_type:complete